MVFHRLYDVIEVSQLNVTLEVVCEHVDFDINNVGSTFTGLEGNRQLVVHIFIRVNLHVDIQLRIVGIGIPLIQHLFIELGMEFLERPQSEVDRFLIRKSSDAERCQHSYCQQNCQDFLH